ncbi:MFS transporter [Longispora albida]|uniref:MFS transporter n=1 Tax=Longispora albida TaxID=203523 RepID=UPI0003727527|nr:MFS transporter [Longispora albida]
MSHASPAQAGPPRAIALAQLTNAIGDGAYYVTSALFFIRIAGLSAAQAGLALTVGWAVGSVAGIALGHVADRRGARGTAVVLALGTAASVGSFLLAGSFWTFLLVICVYSCFQCGLTAARQALLAGLVAPEHRTRARARLQSIVNGGIAVGAGLGGAALYFDTKLAYQAVFALDAVCFLVAALVLLKLPRVPRSATKEARFTVLADRPYAVLTLVNAFLLLYMPLLSLAIPLWIVQRTSAPGWLPGVLLVVNTVSVVLFQVRVARRVTSARTATQAIRFAGGVMFAACAVFALSAAGPGWMSAAVLVAGTGLLVYGEMLLAAGAWELSFGLAPDGQQGQYQGFFGLSTAVARMLGPVLLTTLVVGGGPVGWFALGGLFAAAGLAMGPVARWAARTRDAELVAAP